LPHLVREAVEAIRQWKMHTALRVLWKLVDGVERETRVVP
jgi:hypothetical protein